MDNIKKNCITPYIKRMCAKAGFQCVCGNITTANDGLINLKRHCYNYFHSTYQRPKRNNNKDERSKNSNEPQKDKHEKCKFAVYTVLVLQ